MLKTIRTILARFRAEGHEEIHTPQDVTATFLLRYRDLVVGTLDLKKGVWRFRYSPDFQKQAEIKPLVAFPNVAMEYESPALWPFFMARIPGTSQPEIRDVIETEGLDEHSDLELLRRFGTRTISNPFVLQESA